MKIAFGETLTAEFTPQTIELATDHIAKIRKAYENAPLFSADEVLDAILTVLMMRKAEEAKPGTIKSLIEACEKAKKP